MVVGTSLGLPFYQLLTEDQKKDIIATWKEVEDCKDCLPKSVIRKPKPSQATIIVKECLHIFIENIKLPVRSFRRDSILSECLSSTSLYTLRSKKRSVSFSNTVDCMSNSRSSMEGSLNHCLFGNQETTVFMTLFDDISQKRTSSTQATASINKCLQAVLCDYEDINFPNANFEINSNYCSSSTFPSVPQRYYRKKVDGNVHYSDVYFFGRKKEEPKSGMGSSGSKSKLQRSGNVTAAPVKSEKGKSNVKSTASIQAQSQSSTASAQTKKARGSSAGTCTGKAVSIKDSKSERGPCPAAGGTKGDMVATVSHIRIGPREPCPVHGKDPCQGPKCIVASSGEEQAPVKVSTVTNPRRGVFELVIRRMTGAPLAKNELMLEWTPPPTRPPPCGGPCPSPCSPPVPCRAPKCKMIVCRPSPCKPKCCKKGCKKPCGPMPCRSVPCKKCCKSSCCGKPCRPCKPCPPPPKCRPCPPSPCKSPCGPPCAPPCCKYPCTSPCKSSPCLRPCPIGRRKPRKIRSQPRIKSHRKRISPCSNRSKTCPVVRCRSVPGPCFGCCAPPSCPPRKCCSVAPCKPPKCCKSSCSTCCG